MVSRLSAGESNPRGSPRCMSSASRGWTQPVCRGDKFDSQTPIRDGLAAGQTIPSSHRIA